MKWLLVALLLLCIVALIVPRVAPYDAAGWHVDPETAQQSDKPNSYLISGHDAIYLPIPPGAALARFDAIARADPRTAMIAGSPADAHATYIQRSAIFGFPDYISARARPAEGGSQLSIYSRSRFGHSDMGANKARIERWLEKIESKTKNN